MITSRSILTYLFVMLLNVTTTANNEIQWETDLDTALKKAQETGAPLLIAMHSSTEKACTRMISKIYTDPDVRLKLSQFVLLPACLDKHEEVKAKINGEDRLVSALFKTVDCKTLMKNEADVRGRFFEGVTIKIPNHIFVGSDGKIFMAKHYEIRKTEFMAFMDTALVTYGLKKINSLDSQFQDYFKEIKKGPEKNRVEAIKGVLRLNVPEMTDLLYSTIQGINKEKDKALCIRAMGYKEFSAGAPLVLKWLTDKSAYIKNCAVVTLEEMESSVACKPLLDLYPRAKDTNHFLIFIREPRTAS